MKSDSNFRGRQTCLDDMRKAEIRAVIAVGCTIQTAADYVGVSRHTVYRRVRRDKKFAEEMRKARSHNEIVLLKCVREAAMLKGDWRAATWLLMQCHAERYKNHAEAVKSEQLAEILDRFAEVLVREITDVGERRRVAARLEDLTNELGQHTAAVKEVEGSQ